MTRKVGNLNSNAQLEAIGSDIVRRLGGVWKPGGAMCHCPAHCDRTPSLSVRVGDTALLFKCFAGCDTHEVIRHIVRLEERALAHFEQPRPDGVHSPSHLVRHQLAQRLWDEARPLAGTPGEVYLRRRRIALLPGSLRFHSKVPLGSGQATDFRPALIGALHDARFHEEGRFTAIQRTFFARHDARRAPDLPDPRMMLGRPGRAAVLLAPAEGILGLAEGIETALSAMILFGMPVWATLGAERFHQIGIPSRIRHITLFPDNDRAGEMAVARALVAYADPGRVIAIKFPPARFKDWNDVLRAGGKGVGKGWRQMA
ncbi:toprim domain-containing protein [Novosphingobium profundi]|uniref:DUF7146 domain-containing protein n=1 Tax=Novosphingobium profundi TaxID=1774954 RepID=UPI001BDA2AB6|nr:toprim domain-containing protein [Novosphingobium profundi]MBT0667407.1 toprim domain-containing protein [Novosphingobium profundi]